MRTTVDLPDELYRQVKAQAALQGRPVKELFLDGLRLVLEGAGGGPIMRRRAGPRIILSKGQAPVAGVEAAPMAASEEEEMETKLL